MKKIMGIKALLKRSRKMAFDKLKYNSSYISAKDKEIIIYKDLLNTITRRKRANLTLDIGCGYGRFAKLLSDKKVSTTIICADISKNALKSSIKYLKNRKNIFFVNADAENLPFKNNIFDLVLCIEVISYTDNPGKVLSQIYRVMKEYGTLLISVENKYGGIVCDPYIKKKELESIITKGERKDVKYFTTAELDKLLRKNGFRVISCEKFGFTYSGIFQRFLPLKHTEILRLERICRKDKVLSELGRGIFSICSAEPPVNKTTKRKKALNYSYRNSKIKPKRKSHSR